MGVYSCELTVVRLEHAIILIHGVHPASPRYRASTELSQGRAKYSRRHHKRGEGEAQLEYATTIVQRTAKADRHQS